jgi:hypothetical protein
MPSATDPTSRGKLVVEVQLMPVRRRLPQGHSVASRARGRGGAGVAQVARLRLRRLRCNSNARAPIGLSEVAVRCRAAVCARVRACARACVRACVRARV